MLLFPANLIVNKSSLVINPNVIPSLLIFQPTQTQTRKFPEDTRICKSSKVLPKDYTQNLVILQKKVQLLTTKSWHIQVKILFHQPFSLSFPILCLTCFSISTRFFICFFLHQQQLLKSVSNSFQDQRSNIYWQLQMQISINTQNEQIGGERRSVRTAA